MKLLLILLLFSLPAAADTTCSRMGDKIICQDEYGNVTRIYKLGDNIRIEETNPYDQQRPAYPGIDPRIIEESIRR